MTANLLTAVLMMRTSGMQRAKWRSSLAMQAAIQRSAGTI
jgi:hypothetical protein